MASRASALVCLAVGVIAARPAIAAMTMVLRDGAGGTMTFYQDGSRVRVEVQAASEDDSLTSIVDLKSDERIIVYDDVKAYFDVTKMLGVARAAMEQALKAQPPERDAETASYRALGRTRTMNGFSCAMYERVVGGRVTAEACFALWGEAIGKKEDFVWFDGFMDRMFSDLAGKRGLAAMARSRDTAPGLAIWTSSIADDGKRQVTEVVKVSRDPLPAALLHVPSDYKEISRPLSSSERSHGVPAPVDLASVPGLKTTPPRSGLRISGAVAILLVVVLAIGLLIHTVILHLAASMVLDRPRFAQALVAATILWLVMGVVRLFDLPGVLGISVGALATFASLKISYGAGVGRTLALGVVSGLIAMLIGFAGRIISP